MKKKLIYHKFFNKSWSWEQVRVRLQKQIDSGIVFDVSDWETLFSIYPQATELSVPWNDFTPDEWAWLLVHNPQFADRCSCFDQFLPKQWIQLLASHPEMENRGVKFSKFTAEDWKDICSWNPDFFSHKENWTLRDELRLPFFLKDYFLRHKNLLISLQTARDLCEGKEKKQIRGFDAETGLLRTETIGVEEEIARIIAPFRHEQKTVYSFLSSGKTYGILNRCAERFAQELPLRNRNDLENLIAIANPGPMIYWEEYRDNRPCCLEIASEIAQRTRGVLLYEEQQYQALNLLTGCSPEEIVVLRAYNYGTKLNRPYLEQLIHLIEEHNGVTREKAKDLLAAWKHYTVWSGVRHYKIKKTAHRIYLRALDYLRKHGSIGNEGLSSGEDQLLPGFPEQDS